MFFQAFERARRRRAVRESERWMTELNRLDREHGRGAPPFSSPASAFPAEPMKRQREQGALLPGLLVTGLVLALIIALAPSESFRAIRRLVGFDNGRLATAPTPGVEGSHAFLQTQPGGDEPVGYDPCRPIEVLVNPTGAPTNYNDLVDTGLERVSAATGLVFERVGTTTKIDIGDSTFIRRQPVVIAWATPDQVPGLAGTVAGLAGSVAADQGGRLRYITGHVNLDRDLYASFGAFDRDAAQAIMDHELAHLVGLDHVDDRSELMHPESSARTTFGPGDRAGLARIGAIAC